MRMTEPMAVSEYAPRPDAASGNIAPPIVHEVLNSPGQPLDEDTRAFFETRFGHDLSNVRVHTDGLASESARLTHSLAYTAGSHVAFRADRYQPHTFAGRELLAHELAHVMQPMADGGAPIVRRQGDGHDPTDEEKYDLIWKRALQNALHGKSEFPADNSKDGPSLARKPWAPAPQSGSSLPNHVTHTGLNIGSIGFEFDGDKTVSDMMYEDQQTQLQKILGNSHAMPPPTTVAKESPYTATIIGNYDKQNRETTAGLGFGAKMGSLNIGASFERTFETGKNQWNIKASGSLSEILEKRRKEKEKAKILKTIQLLNP